MSDGEVNELAAKLARRQQINDGDAAGSSPSSKIFNPYTEFPDLSRKEIKELQAKFKEYDLDKSNHINLMELKAAMEKLGAPQTHVALKAMIKEVDEDNDGVISLREFLLIFHKSARGELVHEGLSVLAKEINVAEAGVGGAKGFFEAKAAEQKRANKFEQEIREEQEEKKREAELAKKRREEFKKKASAFKVDE